MKTRCVSAAAMLVACAGGASAQMAVDGQLGASETANYGAIKFVQTVPTGFGDNVAVSGCDNNNVGSPAAVTKGIEIKIPLADLGNPTGSIRLLAFINNGGHGFVSNQFLPSLPAGSINNLGEPRALDLATIANNQFATALSASGAAPVVDGTLDAGLYGASVATQLNRTGFDDDADASASTATGSELDVMYAAIIGSNLHIFLGGNMKSDFTKLELFIDAQAGGVSQLGAGVYADVDFAALQRLQAGTEGPGLAFDSGFTPEYYMTFGCGGDPVTHYPNFTVIEGGANPGYLGSCATGGGNGTLGGGTNPNGIEVAVDNSNIAGVPAICPPPEGSRDRATGSEIDGAYAYLDSTNGYLYLLLTGNMESNYNKLDVFFDINGDTEGQNVLRNDNVDIDFNGLNAMAGLTFDTGFTADYWLGFTNGDAGTNIFANASVLRANGPARNFGGNNLDYGAYNGGAKANGNDPVNFDGARADIQDGFAPQIFCEVAPRTAGLPYLSGGTNPDPQPNKILVTVDNRNVLGVSGGSANGAAAVTTGVEYRIDLAELGWDGTSCIKIAGWVNNGGHNFLSNQVIGGLPVGTTNLGGPSGVNFANIAGDQFIQVGPCGTACAWQADGCYADYDNSGGIDGDDVIAFFADWDGGLTCADADASTGVDGDDVILFFAAWDAGGI
ncbi:MAG: hypothetical protein ACOYN0_13410, partial [Phycisphaerales bacterium]